jgi:hypothetical protein
LPLSLLFFLSATIFWCLWSEPSDPSARVLFVCKLMLWDKVMFMFPFGLDGSFVASFLVFLVSCFLCFRNYEAWTPTWTPDTSTWPMYKCRTPTRWHRYIFIKDPNGESKYIHVHLSWASYFIWKVLKQDTLLFDLYLSIYYWKS